MGIVSHEFYRYASGIYSYTYLGMRSFFMHIRRFLLALSVASSAMSVAFADYQSLNQIESNDRLEQLSRTLGQGSYSHPDNIEIAASSSYQTAQRSSSEASILLNNETMAQRYGSNVVSSSFGGNSLHSWLQVHPLPTARVSSSYGGRVMGGRAENHSGLDLAAPTGTAIMATGPGTVTKAGWGTGYGQYVEVDHGNGYLTRYAHASRLNVSVGD